MNTKGSQRVAATIAVLLMCLWQPTGVVANPVDESICDAAADRFLAAENYPEAIRLHGEFLRKNPTNALAHYHLGFAEGMVGDKTQELREYRRASALGLSRWDFFLNMGLALLDGGNLESATNELRLAVGLNPSRPEPHFNLGLVYERRDMLTEAEQEMRAALRSDPTELDARNMLGVIYARQGKTAKAFSQWHAMLQDAPYYSAARKNLAILEGKRPVSLVTGRRPIIPGRAAIRPKIARLSAAMRL
ncbi:MAG TPA: tetratricopeptide repeat protein [Candidatus Binataceae bacterium]|nr:tetratricopeptide repeat protein [Candidatus Binataceae bacterium]